MVQQIKKGLSAISVALIITQVIALFVNCGVMSMCRAVMQKAELNLAESARQYAVQK